MTNPEASGLFIDDYDGDHWNDIIDFAFGVATSSYLPHQEDEWGCVSATGAFIINQVTGEDNKDAAAIDKLLERRPNTAGDTTKLGTLCLKLGMKMEGYTPPSPLKEPAEKLAYGEITFDDYFQIFQEVMGPVNEDLYELFRDYYENTFIPAHLTAEERLRPYKSTGQVVSHDEITISKNLLESLVDRGDYIFATQLTEGGVSHAVAIFRPELSMPALMFTPATHDNELDIQSDIVPLTQYGFDALKNESIDAFALWSRH